MLGYHIQESDNHQRGIYTLYSCLRSFLQLRKPIRLQHFRRYQYDQKGRPVVRKIHSDYPSQKDYHAGCRFNGVIGPLASIFGNRPITPRL